MRNNKNSSPRFRQSKKQNFKHIVHLQTWATLRKTIIFWRIFITIQYWKSSCFLVFPVYKVSARVKTSIKPPFQTQSKWKIINIVMTITRQTERAAFIGDDLNTLAENPSTLNDSRTISIPIISSYEGPTKTTERRLFSSFAYQEDKRCCSIVFSHKSAHSRWLKITSSAELLVLNQTISLSLILGTVDYKLTRFENETEEIKEIVTLT